MAKRTANKVVSIPAGRPGVPNPVDIHLGQRIRMRRTILGITQEKLGEAAGVSFQQIQKYERGVNRVGGSRLYDFSKILDCPVQFFYDEMGKDVAAQSPMLRAGLELVPDIEQAIDPMAKRETLELVRAYYKIEDATIRKGALNMLRTLGKVSD